MHKYASHLRGSHLAEIDGNTAGKLVEFYFDERDWIIRYLVIETGTWIMSREVLLETSRLLKPDWENRLFPVALTKYEILHLDGINVHKPIGRRQERWFYGRDPWKSDWAKGAFSGGMLKKENKEQNARASINIQLPQRRERSNDPDAFLRSTNRLHGYRLVTPDGRVGHISDFIINDQTWAIEYLFANRGWLGGKKYLIPVSDVRHIDSESQCVFIRLTKTKLLSYRYLEKTNS